MTVIVCIDERGGMSFNGRRVSRDRVLIDNMLDYVGGGRLYVDEYSMPLFAGRGDAETGRTVFCAFSGVPEDEDCFFFAELAFPYGRAAGMDTLVIYRWNRTYPFDTRMEFVPSENGFVLEETLDFEGSSHPKITREIWKR